MTKPASEYYYALMHKDPDSAFGLWFPDLPGCFSASDVEGRVLMGAQQAMDMFADGDSEVAAPSQLEDLLARAEVQAELAAGAVLIAVPKPARSQST